MIFVIILPPLCSDPLLHLLVHPLQFLHAHSSKTVIRLQGLTAGFRILRSACLAWSPGWGPSSCSARAEYQPLLCYLQYYILNPEAPQNSAKYCKSEKGLRFKPNKLPKLALRTANPNRG